ncbi:PERQ amino acid-rich with GYF domain-containing protein 2-like [Fopius arisanus]|uniref:PERQ amino acid-rich with GYF domain-containing protein 2-like n=1 Tax=Fopius arisanus TaxID=64838 RepID=A0A9R1STA7_9HYME|nr:PREDICTED: PERQ amino acid-rich with GYF domain-containing protein 2-like [Fopius arisanus]
MDGDYYSTVYAWFERCGIISNVRTHLRQNLVNALKSKDMTLNKANIGPKSAKQYVYDLLIAEYLWNHNYAYTVSVFASEAPLLVNFRKHVPTSDNEALTKSDRNKLQSDYVCHTLETLGIDPEGPDGQDIIRNYDTNDIPLLLSVLQYVRQIKKPKSRVQIVREDSKSPTKSCRTQTDFSESDIAAETVKIIAAKKKLIKQKELFDNELRQKGEALNMRASHIEQQMTTLDEKLLQVQGLMQAVNLKEKQFHEDRQEEERRIYKKELELAMKENSITRDAERLEKERDSYRQFEANLKNLQEELVKVKQELVNKENRESREKEPGDLKRRTSEASTQTEKCTNETNKQSNDHEKQELQNLVQEQKLRIEELTLRVVKLSRQLEEAQLMKYTNNEVVRSIPPVQASKTILSESSSTDDIIQDAKQRLKRLEQETIKADNCYLNSMITSPL